MQAYRKDFSVPEFNGQFGKLTDRTEGTPVPEPVEGALPKQYFYTVAHASGSERYVFFPSLIFCFCLFREIPCSSVANAYSSFRVFPCFSVANAYSSFRILPWQMLLHSSTSGLTSAAR